MVFKILHQVEKMTLIERIITSSTTLTPVSLGRPYYAYIFVYVDSNYNQHIVLILSYRPFQANVNCSKLITDAVQQRCHIALLASLLLTQGNLFFDVFLTSKVITILRKIAVNFREVSLISKYTVNRRSGTFQHNSLKVPMKKLINL